MRIFVLLSSNPEYANVEPSLFSPFQSQYDQYVDLLLLGGLTFFFFSLIRYLGAKIFSDDQGVAKAKAEIMDNFAVALLFIGLYTLMQLIEFAAALAYPVYFSEGPVNMFDDYIIPTIQKTMASARNLATKFALDASEKLSSKKWDASIFSYPLNKPMNLGDIREVNEKVLKSEININLAIALSVSLSAINYIKEAAGYFFIYGLAMRIFPPLRGAGSFLLALSLGFYYIYPLTTAMFLFGIPSISFDDSVFLSAEQEFCSLRATGAIIIPEQDLSKGFDVTLGNPQTLEEDFGLVVSTTFLLSQLVALSLTSIFVSNFSLILSRGVYTSVGIQSLLGRLL